MKAIIALFAIVLLSGPPVLNPQRFTADTVTVTTDNRVTQLRGNVVMNLQVAAVKCDDASFDLARYSIDIHGDSSWELHAVVSSPDHGFDPKNPPAVTDPQRFEAQQSRTEGPVTNLKGNVHLKLPGMGVFAEEVSVDRTANKLIFHGDARIVFNKGRVTPDDNRGPLIVTK